MSKIKKAVIREDLLSITSDFKEAIILNQFIYWSERIADADILIAKENEIAKNNGEEEREPLYGWIYKTADEMANEVMLGLSAVQTGRYINKLVDKGYLSKRHNPKYKWDRTLQYKVNLVNIARALKKNGYPLSDYKIELPENENSIFHGCNMDDAHEKNQCDAHDETIPENTNKDYIPEIKNTETTNKELNNSTLSELDASKKPKRKISFDQHKNMMLAMPDRVENICREYFGYPYSLTCNMKTCIDFFTRMYCVYRYEIHPVLKNDTLKVIIEKFATEYEDEYGNIIDALVTDDEDDKRYISIIKEYFATEFAEETNYNISHFASGDIIKNLSLHQCA